MNQALASLFEECANAPGALGCGVRLPDRTNRVRSFDRDFPDQALEKALLHLASSVAILDGQDLVGGQFVWAFAGGSLYVATRNDGALFCLVTRKESGAREFFDGILAHFLASA
jgi:hypothetical protein